MDLYHQSYPDNYLELSSEQRSSFATALIIIPGLFGSTANWRGIARQLSDTCPVILIDLRNHGRSPHAETNSYMDMVGDMADFFQQHEIKNAVVCGHSMGGKVAMLFALLYPKLVHKLAVLDIAPVEYQHSHAPFLEELARVDLSQLTSRKEADVLLQPVIPDDATRLFLLQSLAGTAGQFYWRINLDVLHKFMPDIVGFPSDEIESASTACDMLLIYGGKSDYVKQQHHALIRNYFHNADFRLIPDAGHWLHAEQPKKVVEFLTQFIKK